MSFEEKEFIVTCLNNKIRIDGRGLTDFRETQFQQETLLFPNALYGVKVVIPDSKNSLMIGLNAKIINLKEIL